MENLTKQTLKVSSRWFDIKGEYEAYSEQPTWFELHNPWMTEETIIKLYREVIKLDYTAELIINEDHVIMTTGNDDFWGLDQQDKGVLAITSDYENGLHFLFTVWCWETV